MHDRLDQAGALLEVFLGELHDQDRVLAGQAHRGQHRHLEVDVAFQALEGVGQYRAEDAQRGGQQHGGRHAPAFIHRGQAQEHDHQRQRVQQRRLRASLAFLVGHRRPFDAEARRQLLGQLFDLGHGITGGDAWGRFALDFHRRHTVVALQARRTVVPVLAGERAERHHHALGVHHRPEGEVLRHHAERLGGLHEHALDAAAIDEVIDVRTAPRGGQGAVDLVDRQPQRGRLGRIDVDAELRRVFLAVRAHVGQLLAACGKAQQLKV
ncbi:hypothetical protein G6F57_017896 [Rhizopus arrhizus]|nr:hypothetical protein G6F57_017896 [Rhizopus arrhizus]